MSDSGGACESLGFGSWDLESRGAPIVRVSRMHLVEQPSVRFGQVFVSDSDSGRMDSASAEEFGVGNHPFLLMFCFGNKLAERYVVTKTIVSTGLPVVKVVSFRFEN
jgi:hypothetical protein